MNCKDCYWCKLNNALSDEKICCNEAVDYRNMTAWEFASRYYM